MKSVKLFSRVIIIVLLFIIFGVCLVLGKQAAVYNATPETSTEQQTVVSKYEPDYSATDNLVFDIIIVIAESTATTSTTETTTPTETTVTETTTTSTTSATTTQRVVTTTNKVHAIPAVTTTTTAKKVYIVYKPSTHYIHKSTCKWFDKTCKEIENTEGLECRRCSKCKPEMEIVKEYIPPVKTPIDKQDIGTSYSGVTASEIILLQKLVANEYGADWVPVKEKAKIVASIMCQVKDKRFPNTVTKCIYKSCVPFGFNPNKKRTISDSVKRAVQYYFDNQNTVFKNWTANSWYGDGKYNHFYRA